jgi:Asp-tRNA(Asn)/Glu-tRNA(Gln) amidotransferase A subunit family amidase
LHGQTFDNHHWSGFAWVALFNLLGWPATTIRVGMGATGLPLAAQVVAPPFEDDRALAITREIEEWAGGWIPAWTAQRLPAPSPS